jgi:Ran GTPase-activating protein (RanGAP) involved in mRNA processing and transport
LKQTWRIFSVVDILASVLCKQTRSETTLCCIMAGTPAEQARKVWLIVDDHWEKITFVTHVGERELKILSGGSSVDAFGNFIEAASLSVHTTEDVHPFGEAGSPWPKDTRSKYLKSLWTPDQRTFFTLRHGPNTREFALPKAGDVRVIVEFLEGLGAVYSYGSSGTPPAVPSTACLPAPAVTVTTTQIAVPPNKDVSEFWEKFAEVGASIAEAAEGLPMGLGTAAKVVGVLFRGLQVCAHAGKLITECQEVVELFDATLQELKENREKHPGPPPKSFDMWLRMAERALVEGITLIKDLIGNGTQNALHFSLASIREKIKQGAAKSQLEKLIQTIDRCMARGILPVFNEAHASHSPADDPGTTPAAEEPPPSGSFLLTAPSSDAPELALWWRLHGVLYPELLADGLRVVQVTEVGDDTTCNYLTCMIIFGILAPAEANFNVLQVCKTGQNFLHPINLNGCFSSSPRTPSFASVRCCKDTTCRVAHDPWDCTVIPCKKQVANIVLQEPGAIWKILDMLQADSWANLPITPTLMTQVGQACKLLAMAAQGVCPGIVANFLWPKFRATARYAAIVPALSPKLIEADIIDPAYRCAIGVRIFPRKQFASHSVQYTLTNLANVPTLASEPTACIVAKLRVLLQRPRPVDVTSFEALEHWIDESTGKHVGLSATICDQLIYEFSDTTLVGVISRVMADVCAMMLNKRSDWALPLDDTTAWLLRCASFRPGRSLPPSIEPLKAVGVLYSFYEAGCHSALRVLFRSVTSAHKLNFFMCQYGHQDDNPRCKTVVTYKNTGAVLRAWMKHVLKEATAAATQAKAISTLQALCKDEQVIELLAQSLQVERTDNKEDKTDKDVPLLMSVLAVVREGESAIHQHLVEGAGSNVAFKLFLKACFPAHAAPEHATSAVDDSLHHLVYARTDGGIRIKTRPCTWATEVKHLLFAPNSMDFIRTKTVHSPFGHRTVRKVDLTSLGLPISAWVKENPDIAGLEFASWFMFSLLFRDYFASCERKWGTPPVALLIHPNTGKTYLISLDMPGTPGTQFFVDPAVAGIEKLVEKLDLRLLQAVALHSLITSPTDTTPQNMSINTAPDGSTRVAIIDNDLSFGSPFTTCIPAREQSGLASISSWFVQQVPCQLGSAVLAFPHLYQHSIAENPFWEAWASHLHQTQTWLKGRWLDALKQLQSVLLRLHGLGKEPSASTDVAVTQPTGNQILGALRSKQQYHFVPMSNSMQEWTFTRLKSVTDCLTGDAKKSEWHAVVATVHPHAEDRFKDSLKLYHATAADGVAAQLKRLLHVTHRHWHSDGSGVFSSRVQKMENASTISVQGFMRFLVALHVPNLESEATAETFFKVTNPCVHYENAATLTRTQMDEAAALLSAADTEFDTKFADFCDHFGPLSSTNLRSFASSPYVKLQGPLSAANLTTFIEKAMPRTKTEVNAVTELCLDLSRCRDDVTGKEIDMLLNAYSLHLRVLTIVGPVKGVHSLGLTSPVELHALRTLQCSSLPNLSKIQIHCPNLREIHLQHLPELTAFSIGASAEKMKRISSLKLENVDPCVLLDANLTTVECDIAVPATATPLLSRILHIDSYFWYSSGHMIPNVITRNLPHVPWLSEENDGVLAPTDGSVPIMVGRLQPITELRHYEGPFGALSIHALAEGILNGIQHLTAQKADVHTNIHVTPTDAGPGTIVNARPLTSLNPLWFGTNGIEAQSMSLMLQFSHCHITQFPFEHRLPAATLRHLKLVGPPSGASGSLPSLDWPELRMLQMSNVTLVEDMLVTPQLQIFEAISSTVPASVLNCAQLTRVVLHNCRPIQSYLLHGLIRCAPGLSFLDLSGSLEPACSDEMLPSVANLSTMSSIVWNKNPVSDATVEQLALCLAARSDPLELLALSHCNLKRISEVALDCLLGRTRKLNLSGNHYIHVISSAESFAATAVETSVDLARTNEQLVHAVIARLQQTGSITLSEIRVSNVKLSAKSVLALWRIAQQASRIDLSETHMTMEGLPPAADEPGAQAYQYNQLQTLAFSHNNIREIGVPRLIGILTAAHRLKTLDLSSNSLGDAGIMRLTEVLTSSSAHGLRHLHLGFNILTDKCAESLVAVVRAHPKLLTLDLNHNDFSEPALRSICTALHAAKAETLDISYNVYCAFTSALVQAVVRNVHVKHLRMSDIGTSRTHALSTVGSPVAAPLVSTAVLSSTPAVAPTFSWLVSRLMLLSVLESADISRLPDIIVKASEVPISFAMDFVESERRCIIRSALPRIAMHDSAACGASFKATLPLCTLIVADESLAPLSDLSEPESGLLPAGVKLSAFSAIAAANQASFCVVARSLFPLFVFPDESQPLTLNLASRFDDICPVSQAHRYFKPDGMNIQRAWTGMVSRMRAKQITGCNLQVLIHSRAVDDSSDGLANRVHTRRLMIPVQDITDTLPRELTGLTV